MRVIAGNGLRPAIWDEFTQRFSIPRVCEFYAASEGNTAFINVFNVPRRTGICPMPMAYVEYDAETGAPRRDESGRVRRVKSGQPGLLLPGQQAAALRRLHRQGGDRKEVGAQRVPRGRLLVQHR